MLVRTVQASIGQRGAVAFVDQGSTGTEPAAAAATHGIRVEVVTLSAARRGVVVLPRCWVMERAVAWVARVRRLTRDDERRPTTLEGFEYLAFALLALTTTLPLLTVR